VTSAAAVQAAFADAHRREWGRVLAVKAHLLNQAGRPGEAVGAYRQAFGLAANEAERAFLAEQITGLTLPG